MTETDETSTVVKQNPTATIAFIVLIACSILVRTVNIASPLLEEHSFRQTQTAITIWTFVTEGVDFFSYQTPVFGPPWQAPFEFPLFQAVAAVMVKMGLTNIDIAARATNILFFYMSAFFLYRLCRHFFEEQGIAFSVVLCYVLSPYTIFWSRTSMIDYASVAFALGYYYFFIRLIEDKGGLLALFGAVFFGTFGYLIKITTIPTVAFPMAYFIVKRIWTDYGKVDGGLLSYLISEKIFFVKIITAIAVPFAAGYLWTLHADNVKKASLFTQWLTSANLEDWNYGTWKQRLQLGNWLRVLSHIRPFTAMTYALVPIGLVSVFKYRRRYVEFICTGLTGTFLTVSIFFNLYKAHNYYPMAVTPFLAAASGFAVYHIFFVLLKYDKESAAIPLKGCIAVACITILGFFYISTATAYLKLPLIKNKYSKSTVSDFLQVITPPDEYVIIADHLWNPSILYYAKRKGFMINHDYDYGARLLAFLKEYKFTTVLTLKDYPELLSNWKYVLKIAPQGYKIVGYNIYKVTDDPIAYESYKKFTYFKYFGEKE